MKNYCVTVIILLMFQAITAQDIISTKDKKQLDVKVIERNLKVVSYRMSDYGDGPVLMMKTSRIKKIEYKNGYVDLMGYQNPRKNRPLGISAGYAAALNGGGDMVLGTIDYFILPQINIEFNLGTSDLSGELYYCSGARFHLNASYSEHKLTPFAGILYGSYYGDQFIQLPAGISYLTGFGLNTSLSVNRMVSFNDWQATFVELRAGWRFRYPF